MALPTPPAYTTPIPNNPFYSNPSYLLQGATGPYVVGAGLFVDPAGTISSTGGGGGAVSSIVGGAGIGVSSPTGNVVLTNTGVTSLIAGSGITLSGNTGNITISATAASGTVTAVNTGTGLTGGPIVTSGTISLANTGVTAATYTNPTLTVNAQGQITSASSGTAVGSVVGTAPISVTTALGTATVSIAAATTAACGAVQLSDSTSSLSSATAATSLAVKTAFDVAVAAIPKACITAKGTLLTGTGPSVVAPLAVGTNNYVLTADSNCAEGIKWAASTATIADATPLAAGKIVGCTLPVGFGNGITALGNEAYSCGAATTPTPNPATAIGYQAMKLSESALSVAVGQCALYGPAGFGGGPSVAIGVNALKVGGGGDGNVAVGPDAGLSVSTGVCNVIIGCAAASALTSGGNNVLIGTEVAAGKTNGFGGTFIGYRAGCSVGSTQDSTFVGQYAGCGASGLRNTLFGSRAGCALTTGSDNVILGYGANVANPAGDTQLAIGMGPSNWLSGTSTFAIKPGAGIIDCAASCGTANMVLTSQGNAVQWKSVNSALALPNYGSFLDTTTQSVGLVNTPQAVTLNTTVASRNFSIASGSQVTAAVAGTYNLQFSIQLETTSASLSNVEIWLAKNGTAVGNSNTRFVTKGSGEAAFAALNYVETLAAGDYLELIWASDDANMQLVTATSLFGGPQIPSVILTIVPVGA